MLKPRCPRKSPPPPPPAEPLRPPDEAAEPDRAPGCALRGAAGASHPPPASSSSHSSSSSMEPACGEQHSAAWRLTSAEVRHRPQACIVRALGHAAGARRPVACLPPRRLVPKKSPLRCATLRCATLRCAVLRCAELTSLPLSSSLSSSGGSSSTSNSAILPFRCAGSCAAVLRCAGGCARAGGAADCGPPPRLAGPFLNASASAPAAGTDKRITAYVSHMSNHMQHSQLASAGKVSSSCQTPTHTLTHPPTHSFTHTHTLSHLIRSLPHYPPPREPAYYHPRHCPLLPWPRHPQLPGWWAAAGQGGRCGAASQDPSTAAGAALVVQWRLQGHRAGACNWWSAPQVCPQAQPAAFFTSPSCKTPQRAPAPGPLPAYRRRRWEAC